MINHEIPTKNSTSSLVSGCFSSSYDQPDSSRYSLVFSECDFLQWCSLLTIDELQRCFRIRLPEAVASLRRNCGENNKNWSFVLSEQNFLDEPFRNLAINTYRKFIQAVVLVSDKQFLDSITFNSDCFLFPSKVYKLLSNSKQISGLLWQQYNTHNLPQVHPQTPPKNPQTSCFPHPQPQPTPQPPQIFLLLKQIIEKQQKNLSSKIRQKIHPISPNFNIETKQKTDNFINQLNLYWKYCTEDEKQAIWYLGCQDVKKAVGRYLGAEYLGNYEEIQEYIQVLQKIGMRELNQRIFSWKLGMSDGGIVEYMQLLFNLLRQKHQKSIISPTKQKHKKSKKKKIRERMIRRESLSQTSNQTNETDIIYERTLDLNIDQLIQTKLQKDILNLSDNINQQANLYYENRVLAFMRLKYVLECVQVVPKLYGSCCVGLAIGGSDVDVTVQEGVLGRYWGFYGGTLDCIAAFFGYLEYYFANFPWISNVKVIKSATIPIIKFTIDTRIPLTPIPTLPIPIPSIPQQQPIPQKGPVQIDLTVQTTEQSRKHLGIISTKQTQKWLQQIPTLQSVVIILKNSLARNLLNQKYYGGLNTYALLVVVVAVIRKEGLEKEARVSVVLERVLGFYSERFDEEKYGIDLHHHQIFYLKQQNPQISPQPPKQSPQPDKDRQLQVRDPQGDHQIITKNCYQFKKIKKIFTELLYEYFKNPRNKIQQLCSTWNPKENLFDQEMLLEWVETKMREDCAMDMVKIE